MDNSIKIKDRAGINVRPNASHGLWLGFLLPTAILASYIKHPTESSISFRLSATFSIGLALTTLIVIVRFKNNKLCTPSPIYLSPGVITTLICHAAGKGLPFSCATGYASSLLFYKVFVCVLRNFPRCFTLGEALIATQAFQLYAFSTVYTTFQAAMKTPSTSLQIATLIIQVGLASIALLCFLPYRFPSLRKPVPFYVMSVVVLIFAMLTPLHLLLKRSPLLWIIYELSGDVTTMKIVAYWSACSAIAVYAISRQIRGAKKASTVVRKTFHVLAVVVYLPGLIYECSLLYLASGVVFGIFVAIELLRILNLPPLGASLQDGFFIFSDEKDAGSIALTPLYLLIGCSCPVWIHPAPCDLTNSAGFNLSALLSGLLTIGVGDSMASYLGSRFGKHKWAGSQKTIEGTLGCILSQLLAVYLLMHFGFVSRQHDEVVKFLVAVMITSIVEAKTSQVDNLVLPLMMYTILV